MSRSSACFSRMSSSSSPLARLTADQQQRLTEVLDRYLSSLENDAPLDKESILEALDLQEIAGISVIDVLYQSQAV